MRSCGSWGEISEHPPREGGPVTGDPFMFQWKAMCWGKMGAFFPSITGDWDILLRIHIWPCGAQRQARSPSNCLGNCPFLLGSQEAQMASPSHNTVYQEFLALQLKISSKVIQIRLGDKAGGLRETKGGPGREEKKDKSSWALPRSWYRPRHFRSMCMLSHFSRVQLFETLWTVARQTPLSMGFSRQEYWSGLPCPPPRDLPNSGIEPACLTSLALVGGFFTTNATWKARCGF